MAITDPEIRLTGTAGRVRPAAVAGAFYPGDAGELRGLVRSLLKNVDTPAAAPKALIAPHAGYIYSGSTAAHAYATLDEIRERIHRVVLLGPAHRVYLRGLALPGDTAFRTPLGEIRIDRQAAEMIRHLPQVSELREAHAQEHSLEVQLPFLQEMLGDFLLLPLVVGDADAAEVAEVLDILWGGDETLIVISSDLSHFHDYRSARRIDAQTSSLIETLHFEDLAPEQACGARPIQGLLHVARRRGMQIQRLGLCNSGDTAGNRDRVVGYGAWSLYETRGYTREEQDTLLTIAKQSIQQGLATKKPLEVKLDTLPQSLRAVRASFVTLKLGERLRGCIGTTDAVQPLAASVADSAFKAAFEDPRFSPLTGAEFEQVKLSISVLTPPETITFANEEELLRALRPGIDGLTIESGSHRATFLPTVWESIPERGTFLAQLRRKAGIAPEQPVDRAWRYEAESFSEPG